MAAAGWLWLAYPEPSVEVVSRPLAPPPAVQPVERSGSGSPLQLPPAEQLLRAGQVPGALTGLLGHDAVLRFLRVTDFPRHAVATLDSLGRAHAPVNAWPVLPTPGRFLSESDGATVRIAAGNAARYEPFVAFVDSVDAAAAVRLYRRMYPVLQQAYRELGFGDRSLHDRVLEVLDLLLATPEPAQAPALLLTDVKGPIPSVEPWTRHAYADARLERLPAGQKILLRVGAENRATLKAKLREVRDELARGTSGTGAQGS